MSNEKEQSGRMEADVELDSFIDAPLEATGKDIPPGSYPATLFGFGKPFKLKTSEKFRKPGQPDTRTVFELRFGLLDQTGVLVELRKMLPVPDGGKANKKSNLYKALKSLDGTKFDDEGAFKKGTTLKSFLGLPCVLGVKKDDRDWPQIESIAPKMAGAKYPTVKECEKLLTESEDVPF